MSTPHVLTVCTGNICRSPFMERVLRHELHGTGIRVSSAGTSAMTGWPMHQESVRVTRAAGADASGFIARELTQALVNDCDLILTATRDHHAQVVSRYPRALDYTYAYGDFTDLVRLASTMLPQTTATPPPHPLRRGCEPDAVDRVLRERVRALGVLRGRQPPRAANLVDIPDPYYHDAEMFDVMARQVLDALPVVVAFLRG